MSIPHSSDRPCRKVAGQTRGSLRTALAGSALAVAALFGTVALVQPAPVHAQAVRQLPDFTGLVEKTGGAVVNIRTTEHAGNPQGQGGEELLDPDDPFFEFFRRFFPPGAIPNTPGNPQGRQRQVPPGQSGEEIPRGLGSGFIISADGYVMTNHHVVDGADEIYVTLTDKREFKAKLIGSDKNTDVALLKIDATNLPVLPIGDPNKLRVGEWVLAIGSPFGLDNTVTAGIVSAKARETGDYLPFIQTDVAVNPGNSGGPLINMDGQAVGINSQIYSRSGGFMGISFAIPIDVAMNVAEQLKTTGKVQITPEEAAPSSVGGLKLTDVADKLADVSQDFNGDGHPDIAVPISGAYGNTADELYLFDPTTRQFKPVPDGKGFAYVGDVKVIRKGCVRVEYKSSIMDYSQDDYCWKNGGWQLQRPNNAKAHKAAKARRK